MSYGAHDVDHLAADGTGLLGGQVAVITLFQVHAHFIGRLHLESGERVLRFGQQFWRRNGCVSVFDGDAWGIAGGVSDSLITRAAAVALKERRLVLVVRETPYNLIHIRNMETVTLSGGIICPATPSFYSQPANIEEVVDTVVVRVLDLIGVECEGRRWGQI